MSVIYVNDIGTELVLDCGVNISTATLMKVLARNPSGGKKTWVASLNTTTSIKYVLQAGDMAVPGKWKVQSYVEMPGWSGRGEWAEIDVKS